MTGQDNWRTNWPKRPEYAEVLVGKLPKPLDCEILIPGSKSFTNRALILGAAATGTSTLSGILKSDDSFWCLNALEQLGVAFQVDGDKTCIVGKGAQWNPSLEDLYIGSAGTTARFLPGVLAASTEGEWILRGSEQLSNRPIKPIVDYLNQIGASIQSLDDDGRLPLRINAHGLKGGSVDVSGKLSSQFLSGLLIAGAMAHDPVTIKVVDHIVQQDYIHITIDLMRKFGASVVTDESFTGFAVQPTGYTSAHLTLEADASTAGYYFALAALTGGRVKVKNLGYYTRQPDIKLVDVLERMGCKVHKGTDAIEVIGANTLRGNITLDLREMSDQTLTIAVLSVFADGPVSIRNVSHIRHHESDRIHAICTELGQVGIQTEEFTDGLTVYPGTPKDVSVNTYDDHRVAMAFALIGAKHGNVRLKNPGCVAKTCPTYFSDLAQLGVPISYK